MNNKAVHLALEDFAHASEDIRRQIAEQLNPQAEPDRRRMSKRDRNHAEFLLAKQSMAFTPIAEVIPQSAAPEPVHPVEALLALSASVYGQPRVRRRAESDYLVTLATDLAVRVLATSIQYAAGSGRHAKLLTPQAIPPIPSAVLGLLVNASLNDSG